MMRDEIADPVPSAHTGEGSICFDRSATVKAAKVFPSLITV
jgi:hypothetical protein